MQNKLRRTVTTPNSLSSMLITVKPCPTLTRVLHNGSLQEGYQKRMAKSIRLASAPKVVTSRVKASIVEIKKNDFCEQKYAIQQQ